MDPGLQRGTDDEDEEAIADEEEEPRERPPDRGNEDVKSKTGSLVCPVVSVLLLISVFGLIVIMLMASSTAPKSPPGSLRAEGGGGAATSTKSVTGASEVAVQAATAPAPTAANFKTPPGDTGRATRTAQPQTAPTMETSIVMPNNANGTTAGMVERNASSTATTTTTRGARTTRTTTTTTETQPSGWPREAMPYNSLVCTLNANTSLNSVSELPEDGLCDFSFYQAWEERHSMLQGPGGPYAATFELVLQAAAEHNKTEYGLSFDYDFMNNTEELLTQGIARKTLEDLWRKNIYHYAFLRLPYTGLTMTAYRNVFHNLNKVKEALHKGLPPSRPSYFLIAESYGSRVWRNYAFNNIRERLHIQAGVIYGHVTFDDRGRGVVVPPTFWNSSVTAAKYPFNLDTAHAALRKMATMNVGYTRFFLSVTMAGRNYKPHLKPGMLEQNVATKDPLFMSIAEACKNSDYIWGYHNTTPMGAYYHSWKKRRTLTYDDEDSFREKLCKGKKLVPNVKYGLAAYDAELDDRSNDCGAGAYARLRFLKKLLHFFNEKFREASDYEDCLQV